eukprot:CAMPEP_0113642250 /NCGR_PEP_ID=MMETSP0017_2-20120614/22193_1 /TAXON_ID=2856 /ORGANISM="Cylindrotheca closterium" /LENGTH=391 /DNA_ID=CAMNT_0000553659 /DNA_START=46 /DNA_END=1221 /DNA_ORIENTATION=+ /assembly_acc=CAM_ASM_000147
MSLGTGIIGKQYFQERFEELCAYKEAHGNCRVPGLYEKNRKLGRWVSTMRSYYRDPEKKQTIEWKERFAQLDALGFECEVNSWQERFEELCAYKEANGHCRVTRKYEKNKRLANWVKKMRTYHKDHDKKENHVWMKRFAQLETIGFEWGFGNANNWERRMNELRAFKEANGHCRVPVFPPVESAKERKQFASWVTRMRTYHKRNDFKEDPVWKERFARLEALGFEWDVNRSWEERFEELCVYKQAHGHCRALSFNYEQKSIELGKWAKQMRKYYREHGKHQNPVWKERFDKLDALGFQWVGKQGRPRQFFTSYSNSGSNKRQKTASVAAAAAAADSSSSQEQGGPKPEAVLSSSARIAQPPPAYPGGYMQPDGIVYYGDCYIVDRDGTVDL